MEIKQGDKVRVSKDAQEIFVYGLNPLWFTEESTVVSTHPDGVVIKLDVNNYLATGLPIPTKYLIKVDAEAKEPKFRVGDWVKIGETPNPQLNGRVGTISQIDKEGYKISFNDGFFTFVSEEDLTLADEPTEQTEAENQAFTLGERVVTPYGYGVVGKDIEDRMSVMLEMGGYCGIDKANKILTEKADTDWDAYTADLAREIVVKSMEKSYGCDLVRIAVYAVQVAKAVAKGLKKK